MKYFNLAVLAAAVLLAVSSAQAHTYVAYMAAPAPVVAYAPAPVVTYSPVVATSYYVPQTAYYAAPAPYVVAAPVATPYYVASPVVVAPVYARPVVVRSKVYVRGEPVRNVLRAVTP